MANRKNKSFADFGMWLMTSKKAFQTVMLISSVAGLILFGGLSILFFILGIVPFLAVVWAIFAVIFLFKTIKYFKLKKAFGTDMFSGYRLADFMNYTVVEDEEKDNEGGNENGIGTETGKDRQFCPDKGNADDVKSVEQKHDRTTKRVSKSSKEPEPADNSFINLIQESESDK